MGVVAGYGVYLDVRIGAGLAVGMGGAVLALMRPAILAPVAIVTVFLEGLVISGVAVTRFLAPCALLLVVAELLRGGARIRADVPLAWAAAFALWTVASGLWTASSAGTQYHIQSLAIAVVFLLVFAALMNTEGDLRAVLHGLAFIAAVSGALSLVAFASGSETFLGFDLLQAGRSQGFVGDPDFFAAMQLVCVPLILVLANEARTARARLLLHGSVVVILASVFTSLSRGAFLALVVLALLLVASRPDRMFQSRRQKALTLLVASLGMVLFFTRPYVRGQVVDRAQSIYAPKDRDERSGAGRTNLWKAAMKTAGEHPVTGVGAGSFRYISEDLLLRTPGVDPLLLQDRSEGNNFVAHNTYLGTAAELGLTGLLLFAGLLVSTGVMLRRTARRAQALGAFFVARVAHALLIGLAAWAVTSFFLSGETARMLWIVVGLTLALPKLLPVPKDEPVQRP